MRVTKHSSHSALINIFFVEDCVANRKVQEITRKVEQLAAGFLSLSYRSTGSEIRHSNRLCPTIDIDPSHQLITNRTAS
jgi:hypothetical protein